MNKRSIETFIDDVADNDCVCNDNDGAGKSYEYIVKLYCGTGSGNSSVPSDVNPQVD